MGKDKLPGVLVKPGLQQTVNGVPFGAAQLPHPLGRPARGSGQGGLQAHSLKERQHPPQGGGLTCAGAAGEEHHLPPGTELHRQTLLGRVFDPLGLLCPFNEPVQVLGGIKLVVAHGGYPLSHMALGLPEVPQVAGFLPRHLLPDHFSQGEEAVQRVGQGLPVRQLQQRSGGLKELSPGQEGVAVVQIVLQRIEKPGLHPLWVVSGEAQLPGQVIGLNERNGELPLGEQIGVFPELVQRPIPKPLVEGHPQLRGQAVLGEEIQKPPHTHLEPEGLPHSLCPLLGDALDPGQLLRLVLQHLQCPVPELVDHFPGGGDPHPLYDPRGQVVKDRLLPHGHGPAGHLGLELLAVGGVVGPGPLGGEGLPRRHAGNTPHHGHQVLLPHIKTENGIPVLLILIDNGVHRTAENIPFLRHGGRLLSISPVFSLHHGLRLQKRLQALRQLLPGAEIHPGLLFSQAPGQFPPLPCQAKVHNGHPARGQSGAPEPEKSGKRLLQVLPIPPGGEQGHHASASHRTEEPSKAQPTQGQKPGHSQKRKQNFQKCPHVPSPLPIL